MQILLQFIAVFITLILLDMPYLYLTKDRFKGVVANISNKPLTSRYYSAAIVYLALAASLVLFVLNAKIDPKYIYAYAFLLGLLTYAVFDFTNHFMFEGYDLTTSIMDAVWGGVLMTATTFIILKLNI